jgi:anti-sigma factor RsiW
MSDHPEQALLLRYIDGELPGRKSRAIQRHLEACWECRTEVEELQETVAECVRYRKQVLAEGLPAPPQEWRDIYREFDRIDAQTPRRAFLPWRWGLAAATAALAVAGVVQGVVQYAAHYKVREAALVKSGNTNSAASSKITEPPIRNSTESGAVSVEVPPRSAVPSRPAAIVHGPTASISDELLVMSVLHEIGADLGDPVQVSLSDGRVQVSGVGVAPERKQKILAALEPLPNVARNFSDPPRAPLPNGAQLSNDAALPNHTQAQPAAASTAPGVFQSRLEAQLGGRGPVDRFAGQVLNWNESAMAHAYALRLLAQKFPPGGSIASMNEQDRATLRGLARDHLVALAAPLADFDRVLVPVLIGLGATSSRTVAAADAWQGAAEQVFQAARRIEVLSSLLLGVTPGESGHADLPSELLGAVNELRADLDQNQRLLGR